MELLLNDKVFIITGGASGVGASICEALQQENAIPFVIDSEQGEAFTIRVDLTDQAACGEAVKTIAAKSGRIDGLVNCAGHNDHVGLENGDHLRFTRSLYANAMHYYTMAYLVLPWLKQSRGSILNIISDIALRGRGNASGYAASNGIRLGLTRAWAEELGPYGIRVNGLVITEGFEALDRIAATASCLLSPVSPVCNGELVHVDGGYLHPGRIIETGSGSFPI